MTERIWKIGTRGSLLAMTQTRMVQERLAQEGIESEAVILHTRGDRLKDKPLWKFGGKAVFVTEFEEKILSGEIDMAVHSAKDMPAKTPEGLVIGACLPRENPADVLVVRRGNDFFRGEAPAGRDGSESNGASGPLIGTSSLRREMQLREQFGLENVKPLRGNVPTRLEKLRTGQYDGVILAAAGLARLGLDHEPDLIYHNMEEARYLPAAGQGIIAVECRKGGATEALLKKLNDRSAAAELAAERGFMYGIAAGCHEPVAAHAVLGQDGILRMKVMKYGNGRCRYFSGEAPEALGGALAENLAGRVLAAVRPDGEAADAGAGSRKQDGPGAGSRRKDD